MSKLSKQAFNGNLAEVKRIVESNEFLRDDLWAVSCAIKSGVLETVKFLVDNGLPIQKYSLNQAVNSGSMDIVKFLVDKGQSPEEEDLDDAINNGFFDIAYYLLDLNCPISAFAVDDAVSAGNTELVGRLIDKGAKTDNGAISQAIGNKDISMIKFLMSKGKKVRKSHLLEAISVRNISAMSQNISAMSQNITLIKFVLEQLDPCYLDQSVLQAAIDSGFMAIIKLVVNSGVKVCEENIHTALTNECSFELFEFLASKYGKDDSMCEIEDEDTGSE